jgi:geranylgeranyl pyrophosphate synthase
MIPASAELVVTDDPGGLSALDGLDEVEARMVHLAVGARLDRVGRMVQEHLGTGGSRTRARLAFAAAEALGRTRADAIGWAAACELVHNATLVHDDLQDGDPLRRGSPALWSRYGAAQAINAGDLLLMLPFLALDSIACDDATRWRLSHAIARRSEHTVRGQAFEMELVGAGRLDWASWATAAEGKSGALLALPVEGAAILAGLRDASVTAIGASFARIGVLYQLHDDVRDLWGDKGRDRRGNDLREGKASAVVAVHLAHRPEDRALVLHLLTTPREATADVDVDAMIDRFETAGTLRAVRERSLALEERILGDAMLRSIPDLHAIAAELVAQLRAAAPWGR